jgi:hypothetical protein
MTVKYVDIKDIRIQCDTCGEGGPYGGDFLKKHHEKYGGRSHYKHSTIPKVYEKNNKYILICDHDWNVTEDEQVKCSICDDILNL